MPLQKLQFRPGINREGVFCVFPSYLEHYVEPSKAYDKRISVAFNFLQA
jgi:hypothetical protein